MGVHFLGAKLVYFSAGYITARLVRSEKVKSIYKQIRKPKSQSKDKSKSEK